MFKRILLLHYGITLFLFTTIISAQEKEKPKQLQIIVNEDEAKKIERETDYAEATPIQCQDTSPINKKLSMLFPSQPSRGKIHDNLREGGLLIRKPAGTAWSKPGEVLDIENLYISMADNADAVIVGYVKRRTSFINESDDFILTQYEIIVSEIFKNNFERAT